MSNNHNHCFPKGKVIIVLDGMAGSCGKGKIVGYIAQRENVNAAISNAMPNSGHTYVSGKVKRVFKHLPVSCVNKDTILFIGAGSAISMDTIMEEYDANLDILEGREIIVHPYVPIIKQRHIEIEQANIRSGSTFKGGGACNAEKILRNDNVEFFKEYKSIHADSNYVNRVQEILDTGGTILLEGSQGCDLDLNYGTDYPHVTSRQCSASQILADSGISPIFTKKIIMVIRPYPIRISNKTDVGMDIYSGGYGSSEELGWDDINSFSGVLRYGGDYTELTTVTKKVRRVFVPDLERLRHNVAINRPTEIALNFAQHICADIEGANGNYNKVYVHKYVRTFIDWIEDELNVPVTLIGTGADNSKIIRRNV